MLKVIFFGIASNFTRIENFKKKNSVIQLFTQCIIRLGLYLCFEHGSGNSIFFFFFLFTKLNCL